MEQQVRRYALGAAAAAFVLVWTTLGFRTAVLALAAALVATNHGRLAGVARSRRRPAPGSRRPPATIRVRPLHEEGDDELPLVPEEPSLVITAGGF